VSYFKDVVYRYEYERAIREGFLVDYDVVKIKSNVRMNGIFLKEGEEVGIINPESGAKKLDQLEDERQFDITQIERDITAPESNRKILEEVRKTGSAQESDEPQAGVSFVAWTISVDSGVCEVTNSPNCWDGRGIGCTGTRFMSRRRH